MMQYGDLRSSFSPQGREYVTRWNPQTVPVVSSGSPISGLGGSSSPLASALMGYQPTQGEGRDGGSSETGKPESGVSAGNPAVAGAVPTPNFGDIGFSDFVPSKSGLAGAAANIGGTLISGSPVVGALANAGTAMATGTGTGKAIGSAGLGLLGGLVGGPIGAIGGSWLGGKLGGQFDPDYGGFQTVNNPAAVANAQQAALSNIESTEGGGNSSGLGYVDANNTNAYSDIGLSSGGGGYDGGGYGAGMNDGSGSDAPGGFAKGGHVTRDRLIGPDPHGPDDGYAALDAGEFVIKASDVKKLGGPDKTRKRLAELLASK